MRHSPLCWLFLSLAPAALAQYRVRKIYSDYKCSQLLAIKSEYLLDEHWSQDAKYTTAQEAMYKCQQDVAADISNIEWEVSQDDSSTQEWRMWTNYGCEYAEDTYAGVTAYQKESCSWDLLEVEAEKKVLLAEYENGCPGENYHSQLRQYTSLAQQCIPLGVSHDQVANENGEDKEEEGNGNMKAYYYQQVQQQQNYSYYHVSCNSDKELKIQMCRDSNCSDCIMTTYYSDEESCYPFEMDYMRYWCNGTISAESTSNKVEVSVSAIVAVLASMGSVIIGLAAMNFFNCAKGSDQVESYKTNLQHSGSGLGEPLV